MVPAALLKIFYWRIFVWMAKKIHATTGCHFSPPVAAVMFAYLVVIGMAAAIFIARRLKHYRRIVNEIGATGRFAKFFEICRYLLPGQWTFYIAMTVTLTVMSTIVLMVIPYILHREPIVRMSPLIVLLSAIAHFVIAVTLTEHFGYAKNHPKKWNHFLIGRYSCLFLHWRCVLTETDRSTGVLVVGPTSSGKTSSFLVNNVINDAEGNSSDIVIDRKTDEDIAELVGHAWTKAGKPVICFAPYVRKFHFNPLWAIKPDFTVQATHDQIKEIVDSIFQGYAAIAGETTADADHHKGIEERLLKILIMCVLALPEEYRNLPTVFDICKRAPQDVSHVIALSNNQEIVEGYKFFADLPANQQANALQGLFRKLQFLESPEIRANMIRNDLDLNMIFKQPCVLVIKAPLHRPEMGILSSLIVRLIQMKHYAYADECKQKAVRPRTIAYHLDEFPHLNLPNIHSFATTIRSSRGSVVLYIHDLQDLRRYMDKFRSGSAEGLESSLRTWIILPGCGAKMCMEISKAFGDIALERNRQGTMGKDSYSYSAEKRALETHDNLHFMNKDNCLVLRPGETRPFYCEKLPYFEDRKIRHLVKKNVNYWKPKKVEQIVQGSISDLIKKRGSDVRSATSAEMERSTEEQTSLPHFFDYISGASEQRKCNKCGKLISKAEADYCALRNDRFVGQLLCRECQRAY